ncbi:HDOD domain-containing protein [Methylomarinum sp. Ch1-1]|uniref:HDOD domain-containing protein n=1 Tax=Methylomarinum roseum TaxID=3067653 RepID=A0AAU7NS02_9GAMM|nr:HDOD domain-containing protein [Methylomarinum sp. Ch1-1]MDP4520247.1 HDOD domain-containing protein [Methylomarinum sp. Ch1-1]
MAQLTPRSLVEDSIELFSLPDIYFQINEMINDPKFSIEEIGRVVSKDPALSARLLKVVNSPFYGFQAKIDTVSRAVVVVGLGELKNLVLATTVVDNFRHIPAELVDMTAFWMRSVHCGVVCKLLAKASAVLHCERLFLTGLLHNIGSLVLYQQMPKESLNVLLAAGNDRSKVAGLEQEIIGFNHAEVGSELIKAWGLPESLSEAIGCYLDPQLAQVHRLDAYLLSLAVRLVDAAEYSESPEVTAANFKGRGLSMMRLSEEQIVSVAEQAADEFSQVFELVSPNKKFH